MRRTVILLAFAALALAGCTAEEDKAARYWDGYRFGEQTATDYAKRVLDTNLTYCETGGEVAARQDMCTRPGGPDTRYPASVGQRACADALPKGCPANPGEVVSKWKQGCSRDSDTAAVTAC
ncbi:hypothetical protein ABZ519_01775 [Streptomyces collinus]|jgi:hypothetical protein|uniref:hypothetical protein n=1 Tax=Streptomyces collinus TaxID=42684 RepID=UPI0033DC62BD